MRTGIKVALGIGNERAERTAGSDELGREPKELAECRWPALPGARRTVNSQRSVYRLHNDTVSYAEPLVGRLKAKLRICVVACASEPLVIVRKAWKAGESWIRIDNGLGTGHRGSKRHKRNRRPTRHCGADVSGIVAWVVGLDFQANLGRTHACLST